MANALARARSLVERPAVTLGAFALLFVSARAVSQPARGAYYTIPLSGWIPGSLRAEPSVYVVRDGDRWTIANPDRESWDRISRALTANPGSVVPVSVYSSTVRLGVYAPTSVLTHTRFDIGWGSGTGERPALDEDSVVEISRVVREWLSDPAGGNAPFLADALPGSSVELRLLPLGYVHNTAAAIVLGIGVWSLAWVPRVPRDIRAFVSRRRRAAGECPACRYPVGGLRSGRCPECGRALD